MRNRTHEKRERRTDGDAQRGEEEESAEEELVRTVSAEHER